MASALHLLPHYTYEDWVRWEGKWELIYGIPNSLHSDFVPNHQIIAGAIAAEFGIALKKCICYCKAILPIAYRIADDIIVQPDLLVVCDKIEKPYLDFAPSLVAEILSPSTALKDRHTKFQIYESQEIPYYIIVSPDVEEVEIFTLSGNVYQLAAKGKEIQFDFSFEEDCIAAIDFAEIWK